MPSLHAIIDFGAPGIQDTLSLWCFCFEVKVAPQTVVDGPILSSDSGGRKKSRKIVTSSFRSGLVFIVFQVSPCVSDLCTYPSVLETSGLYALMAIQGSCHGGNSAEVPINQ